MEIGTLAARLLLILFSAVVGEGAIEFLLQPIVDLVMDKERFSKQRTVLFNFASALLGVGIAFGFDLGVFALLGGMEQLVGLDSAFTGVLLGRGSNYIHGLLSRFFANVEFIKKQVA